MIGPALLFGAVVVAAGVALAVRRKDEEEKKKKKRKPKFSGFTFRTKKQSKKGGKRKK